MSNTDEAAGNKNFSIPLGGIIAFALAVVALIAFIMYQKASQIPNCTDPDVAITVKSIFREGIRARDPSNFLADVKIAPITEVGYASEAAIRGCTTTVNVEGEAVPYAFQIGRDKGDANDLTVSGANPIIVAARFGHLDQDGKFKHRADPVGRDTIARLVRAAAEEMRANDRSYAAASRLLNIVQPKEIAALRAKADPERLQAVADLELGASCRRSATGSNVICPLVIEHNTQLSLFAMGPMIVEADIVFKQDAGSGGWVLADGFDDTFTKAVQAARERKIGQDVTAS